MFFKKNINYFRKVSIFLKFYTFIIKKNAVFIGFLIS